MARPIAKVVRQISESVSTTQLNDNLINNADEDEMTVIRTLIDITVFASSQQQLGWKLDVWPNGIEVAGVPTAGAFAPGFVPDQEVARQLYVVDSAVQSYHYDIKTSRKLQRNDIYRFCKIATGVTILRATITVFVKFS